jgi:hypothetical protein
MGKLLERTASTKCEQRLVRVDWERGGLGQFSSARFS